MKPYWFSLLEEQRYGRGITMAGAAPTGRLGLTVTFLLGANPEEGSEAGKGKSISDLQRMLAEMMVERERDVVIRIYECGTLHEPTACFSEQRSGSLGDNVTQPDGGPSNLYAWSQYFVGSARDLESLTNGLWNLLQKPLTAGDYSFRHGYKPFHEDDKDFIARAFARETDE